MFGSGEKFIHLLKNIFSFGEWYSDVKTFAWDFNVMNVQLGEMTSNNLIS